MNKPIINLADVELKPRPAAFAPTGPAASQFDSRMAHVGTRLGAQKLGYNVTAVPPGKAAFPFHSHRVNEEMFLVLQGSGEIRIGGETHAIRQGDIIACPPGGPDTAHQIRNTGSGELRYLAVSTLLSPEIAEYPDSNKFGIYAQFPPAADGKPGVFRFLGRESMNISYWSGEGGNEG